MAHAAEMHFSDFGRFSGSIGSNLSFWFFPQIRKIFG